MSRIICTLMLIASIIICCWWSYQSSSSIAAPCQSTTIVCTTTMLADAVYNLAGNCITLHTLMGPGIDPHLYKAKPSDMHLLLNADCIIYHGLHLEGKMVDILASLSTQKKIINVGALLDQKQLIVHENSADPHIWHDVQLWQQAIAQLYQELLTVIPVEYHAIMASNYQKYMQELTSLDAYIKNKVTQIPRNNRRLVTAHDAFSYFGRAYDLEVVGLQGISTDAQVGIQDVNRLVDYLVEYNVPALFVESSIPQRTLQAVVQATAAQGVTVKIGGQLLSDALGGTDPHTATYILMMQHNVNTITDALRADVVLDNV